MTSKRDEINARYLISAIIVLVVVAYSCIAINHINLRTGSPHTAYFVPVWVIVSALIIAWNTKKQRKKMNNMKENYLFFDTKTTGLPRDYNAPVSDTDNWPRLVQLGWIVTDNEGKILKEREFIIKPEGFSIPDNAIKVHGITTEKALKEGENVEKILAVFYKDLATVDFAVAHNVSFDVNIVSAEFNRLGIVTAFFGMQLLCTKESGTMVCKIPRPDGNGYKWPSLKDLHTRLFGQYFEGAHSALADAKAAAHCFWEMRKMGAI